MTASEVPGHLKHGVGSWARRRFLCDCPVCLPSGNGWAHLNRTRAMTATERGRKLQENKRGKPVPDDVKHGIYAYRVYGCRCEDCRAANAAKKYSKPTGPRPRGHWYDDPATGKTTVHWPPADLSEPWNCPDCGEEFGSTQGNGSKAS